MEGDNRDGGDLLQPNIALLVDQRVVEADAVLVINIGRGELANPLVDATIGKIAEHLRGDAPGHVGVLAGTLALARRVGPDNALDEIAGPVGDPQPDKEVPDLVRRHLARVDGRGRADDIMLRRAKAERRTP